MSTARRIIMLTMKMEEICFIVFFSQSVIFPFDLSSDCLLIQIEFIEYEFVNEVFKIKYINDLVDISTFPRKLLILLSTKRGEYFH